MLVSKMEYGQNEVVSASANLSSRSGSLQMSAQLKRLTDSYTLCAIFKGMSDNVCPCFS